MSLFLTSITSIIPIITIIVLGYILQVKGWFGDAFGPNLSRLIMNVALPASIFVSVMKYLTLDKLISLSGGLLYTFVAFILGYIVAYIAVMIFKVRPGRRGTMINTFVNANTIFIAWNAKRFISIHCRTVTNKANKVYSNIRTCKVPISNIINISWCEYCSG